MYSLLLNPSVHPKTVSLASIPVPSSSSRMKFKSPPFTPSSPFHSWFQPINLKPHQSPLMAPPPKTQHDGGLHLDTSTVHQEIDSEYKGLLLYMNHLSESEKVTLEGFRDLRDFLSAVVEKSSGKMRFVPMFDMVYGLGCVHMLIHALSFLLKKDTPNAEQGKDVTIVLGDELKHEVIESVGVGAGSGLSLSGGSSSRGVVYIVFNRAKVKDFFLKNEWVGDEADGKKIGLKEMTEAVEFAFQSDEKISVVSVPTLFFGVLL